MKGIEWLHTLPLAAAALFLAACASAPPAPTPAQKSELAPTGTLRVAAFTGNPVLGSRDKESGEVSGTTATLGRELAKAAGVPVKIIAYGAIAKLVGDAKTGEWDVAVVAFDPARRNVIDFAPPHIVVDLTYLVAPGSAIRSVPEADRPGVSIAAARGAATTLFLERTLKSAKVVQADNEPAAFALIRDGKVQAYAQNRYLLLGLAGGLPGSRVLEDRFSAAEMCLVLPKGRSAALAYVSAFVEDAKRSGTVQRALDEAKLRGVSVAPALRENLTPGGGY
ncbi:MAG TPA: transporter substrate-binding domain-containing protein [Burkholderiales bacterium]|nr:transporter substrate-binding domain-containing protein [Burkholderiales bacterium]